MTRAEFNYEFVTVWMTAEDILDVAVAFGMTKQQTISKASYLRKRGVNLPKIGTKNPWQKEVDDLNKLVAKLKSKKAR